MTHADDAAPGNAPGGSAESAHRIWIMQGSVHDWRGGPLPGYAMGLVMAPDRYPLSAACSGCGQPVTCTAGGPWEHVPGSTGPLPDDIITRTLTFAGRVLAEVGVISESGAVTLRPGVQVMVMNDPATVAGLQQLLDWAATEQTRIHGARYPGELSPRAKPAAAPDCVYMAEKAGQGHPEMLGVFSDLKLARRVCQAGADEYFGPDRTPPLRWLEARGGGYCSASYQHPCDGTYVFQVTRFAVDQPEERG